VPAYLFLGAALILNALANVLIKYSMSHAVRPLLRLEGTVLAPAAPFTSWTYILAIVCFASNLACYSLALRSLKLSLAYPLMVSLGYLVILSVQYLMFGERLSALQYAGVGLILVGVWFVVR
jgi:multidrug transporter EmrE-like cation transporter